MKRLWLIILGIVVLVLGALAGAYSLWREKQDQRMEILYGPPPIGEPQGIAPGGAEPGNTADSTQPEVAIDETPDTGEPTE